MIPDSEDIKPQAGSPFESFVLVWLVILAGVALRLFAFNYTYVINPDGVHYIHQARAIYYGDWKNIFSCGVSYLSNFPLFIALFYKVAGDWVFAAKSVSLLFGSLLLVPLYLLFRRFFDKPVSLLGTLVFALIPNHVDKSADVLRGPVAWFFLVCGMYFFVLQSSKRSRLCLVISSISFLMAAWARVEFALFFIISFLFIIFSGQKGKAGKLLSFGLPAIALALIFFLGSQVLKVPASSFSRGTEIVSRISSPALQYKNLRSQLGKLASGQQGDLLSFFLPEARKNAWLVGLGTLLGRALAAFFYPYFLVFLIGLAGLKQKLRQDRRVVYFTLLCVFSLLLLYLQTLETWILHNRFMAMVIFPGFLFFGFGLEKLLRLFENRLKWKKPVAVFVLLVLILASGLPKNLKPREDDKVLFKKIGTLVAEREDNRHVAEIAGISSPVLEWINFYANLKYPGAPCPRTPGYVGEDYSRLLRSIEKKKMRYFLWEERTWKTTGFDLMSSRVYQNLRILGKWRHPDTGNIVLFEVK